MSGKNSKVSKTETPVVPVVEAVQKGGKKVAAKTVETARAPASAPVAATPAQKGGKKAAAVSASPAPVAAATPAQKGGKKAAVAKTAEVAPAAAPVAAAPTQKGGKKVVVAKAAQVAPAAPVAPVAAGKTEVAEAAEEQEGGDKRIRSFKVRLPGKEDFEGRFTGLTPYQAANKALSKYFRETDKPKFEITFSICESTRKSKKAVYTYVGCRHKLDNPVTYNITNKDTNVSREIVKHFKNSLKKVKKSEVAAESA